MAFMMPVVKNDWDIYKANRSRRVSECSNTTTCRSRKVSECRSEGPSLSTSPGSEFVSSPIRDRASVPTNMSSRQYSRASSRTSESNLQSPVKSMGSSPPKNTSEPNLNKFHNRLLDKLKKSLRKVNLKGFLCSCNNREKDCIREAYNLLNKYADKLYPTEATTNENEADEGDIEKALTNELLSIRNRKKRFQQVESGANNFLFIKTTLDDPVKLAHSIVCELKSTGVQQTKFLIRLVPIEVTCKAYIKDICAAFKPLAERYFKENPTTFSVVYNHRNNNNLNRDEVIKAVAETVFQVNAANKVDLKVPNVSVIVEVIKGIALLGVVPEFVNYKKYNLLAITDDLEKKDDPVSTNESTVNDKEDDLSSVPGSVDST
ncbi:unnamed protein product [Phyllotreta striolata]|uniref:THUMP domain-containing protein n=1 Tax=Phyllotreta striolata TaxID=444603 RepID=A0A9N9XJI9_PHYSR|nr:unnamed protein product [Phyllotreta striolata]